MSFISENTFEKYIIEKLVKNKWLYFNQKQIFKMRGENLSEVLLFKNILSFLRKDKKYSNEVIDEAILKLKKLHDSNTNISNKIFQKIIIEGIKVIDKERKKTISVKVFDFENTENNEFIVTNQFIMKSLHPEYQNQFPDIVLYINGIPVVVMELKKPLSNVESINEAFQQIKNYQDFLPNLFTYNAFNLISNYTTSKIGTITSTLSRYKFWRGKNFNNSQDKVFEDLFDKKVILDVIVNYTFWTEDENSLKIMSGYHQYYGTKELINSSVKSNNGKGGVFWHTQGSGKSFSMLFYIRNMTKMNPNATFIVVTDRRDLDNQIFSTFKNASSFIGQKIYSISSIKDLVKQLKDLNQNGVFFTTVQKFKFGLGKLSDRRDIFFITDEAHRSHNSIDITYRINNDNGKIEEKHGNAKVMRDAFPNATFVGFTGTPIESEDKSTSRIFGKTVTKYLMKNAERDNVIVPIQYESRKPELSFNEEALNELEKLNEKYVNNVALKSNLPLEVRKKINKISQSLSNFILDPDRIRGIAEDFVVHYNKRRNILKGKAMFVALNRHAALKYYNEIIKIDASLKKHIKLIVNQGNKQSELRQLIELAGNSKYRNEMGIEFKKPDSEFKIAIVVDMWLTGFDVQSLDLMYLDKPIKMHNLMQAIARTNRVYTDNSTGVKKESGLIVDYIGIWKKLNEALAYYSGVDKENIEKISNLNTIKEDAIYQANFIKKTYFNSIEIDKNKFMKDEKYRYELVRKVGSLISKLSKEQQQSFVSAGKIINKNLKELISVLKKEEAVIFQIISVVKSYLINLALERVDFGNIKSEIIKQLDKTIKFESTVEFKEDINKKIKLSKIIDFILNKKSSDNLDIEEKVSATYKLIKGIRKINLVLSKKLRVSLNELMNKYNENYVTLEELKSGLHIIAIEAKKQNDENSKDLFGFSPKEKAFYNILFEPVKNISKFDKEKIAKITKELLLIINNDQLVNSSWMYNEHMISKVRGKILILLVKYNYPPEELDSSAKYISEQIIEQRGYGKR